MSKSQTIIILLCLWILLVACQVLSLPTDEAETATAITASPTIVAVIETPTLTRSPSFTPTVVADPDTATQLPTNTPIAIDSTEPTLELSSEFEVIEAQVDESTENSQLVLPITLNTANLSPPVQDLVYLTVTENVMENLSEATFWRADIHDVNNPQRLHSDRYLPFSGPSDPIISPDGRYLVYGLGLNDHTHSMHVVLLDINTGVQTIVDDFAFNGGAAPRANSQAFAWATDSRSFVYIKDIADSTLSYSDIYQYSLETNSSKLLFQEERRISLVGWLDQTIYYLINKSPESIYPLKSFALDTGQIEQVSTIEGPYANSSIRTSPDNTHSIFHNGNLITLQSGAKTQLPISSHFLWNPDSSGFLVDNPPSIILPNYSNNQSTNNLSLTLNLSDPHEEIHWMSWSPDGQYLVYRTKDRNEQFTYFLFYNQLEQTQILKHPINIIGWISE